MRNPTKLRTLEAIKPHKYGTRHLVAGEEYEAPPRHAVALVAARKARFAPDKSEPRVVEEAAPPSIAAPQTEPERAPESTLLTEAPSLDGLRLQATALGINVNGRWGVARLQHEIAQATRG